MRTALQKTLYPVTVYFERAFTVGALAGLTIADQLSFVDAECARIWVQEAPRNNKEIRVLRVEG